MTPASTRGRLAEEAADALRSTMMAMRFGGRGFAAGSPISPVSWVVLRLIREAGESTPSGLARRMGVSAATVTRILDRLEEGGFVERVRKVEDRRVVQVRATPKAGRGMERFRSQWLASAQEVFSALSDVELALLVDLLRRAAAPGIRHPKAPDW